MNIGPVRPLYPYANDIEEALWMHIQNLNPIPEHEGFEYRPMIDPATNTVRQMFPQDLEKIKNAFALDRIKKGYR